MPPPEQVVVRASAPEDLLALVVHTLGFWPEESVVLVSLRGPRRRTGLVLRVDLAPVLALGSEGLGAALDQLVAPVAGDGASAAVVLLHTRSGGVRPEHRALAGALAGALGRCRVDLEEAALVDGRVLFSLTCDRACCPPQGRRLGDVAATVVGAEMVAQGRAPAADRESAVARLLAGVAPEDPAVREAVAAAGAADPASSAGAAWSARPLAVWFALVDATAGAAGAPVHPGRRPPRTVDEAATALLDPAGAAGLLAALGDLVVRDAVLLSPAPGARQVLLGSAFDAPGGLAQRLATALELAEQAPDAGEPGTFEAARALLRRAARMAPDPLRARPLAVLAHWGWWRGSTVEATALAEAALALDPGMSLPSLVLQLADHGVPPPWVRAGSPAGGARSAARRGPRSRARGGRPGSRLAEDRRA